MASDLPEDVQRVRLDLSDWVWHFTRRDGDPLKTLQDILSSGHIKGSKDRFCSDVAVCFTEMPLTEAIRQSSVLDEHSYARLSDYGIGFRKEWIFERDGLPVIYQPNSMRDHLPADIRWRHCDLDYGKGIDFSWQREWRVPKDRLDFTTDDDAIVVVQTEEEAFHWLCDNFHIDHERDEFYFDVVWSYVSHEQLREAKTSRDIEAFRVQQG